MTEFSDRVGKRLPGGDKQFPANDLLGRPIRRRRHMMTDKPIAGTLAFVCVPVNLNPAIEAAKIEEIKAWLQETVKVEAKTPAKPKKAKVTDENNA